LEAGAGAAGLEKERPGYGLGMRMGDRSVTWVDSTWAVFWLVRLGLDCSFYGTAGHIGFSTRQFCKTGVRN
jgi:hypothetical protein